MPGLMVTDMSSRTRFTFLPWHVLHLSLLLMLLPSPPHSGHTDCVCAIMPIIIVVCIMKPLPLQRGQRFTAFGLVVPTLRRQGGIAPLPLALRA